MSLGICVGVRHAFRTLSKGFETCVLVFDVELTSIVMWCVQYLLGHPRASPKHREQRAKPTRACGFNQGSSRRTVDTLPLEAHGAGASSGFFMACTVTDKTPLGAHPICCSQSEYRSSLPVAWSLTATPAAQRRQQAHTLHRRTQNSAKPTTLPISGLKIKTIRAQTCILPSLFLLSFLHLWFRQGDHLRDEELA